MDEQRNSNLQMQNQYDSHNHSLVQTIKNLQQEIDLTIYNYQQILQTEKKTSSDRSQFLLYLIQSLRSRHVEQLEAVTLQLQQAEGERQQANTMQKQMENIGEGLDQIVDESHKLKATNENLQKQLEDQQMRDKQMDEEIQQCEKELDDCRLKVDQWERVKIKWNRQKKEMLQMIEQAQSAAAHPQAANSSINICQQTGQQAQDCEHCKYQQTMLQQLCSKYIVNQQRSTT